MKGTTGDKDVRSVGDGDVGTSNNGPSKKALKGTYEKLLDDISKELQAKSGCGNAAKRQKMKPEQEIVLLEQKCILLLKLKRHKEVIDDGYSIIGRMGPNVVIYKCILIALVRLAKPEDDIIELMEAWKKATPKCPHMLETKRKFDGYLAALRSGMKYSDIFSNIEDTLVLNANSVLSKQFTDADEKKWRFRAPPPRHTTFSLCPRSISDNSCIYGEECLFAHSQDELKEWKLRVEMDKKGSPLEDTVEDCSRSTKKRPIPNIYKSLLIPPLCIHYLLDLGKKIKDAADIKEILTDDLPGIKFKVVTPLKHQKRIDGTNRIVCTWSFMVGSKNPMGTVSILHDANRECFRISSGMYYNKKKESLSLIELHPNNKVQTKLQVLNTFIQPSVFLRFNSGWPDMCYYKVDVTFESLDSLPEPGLYRQSVVFDFKKDPKLVKHISVQILPKLEPIENDFSGLNVSKSVWAATPAADISNNFSRSDEQSIFINNTKTSDGKVNNFNSKNCDFPTLEQCRSVNMNEFSNRSVGFRNFDVVDSESGLAVKLKGLSLPETSDSEASSESNLFFDDVPLNMENYSAWMRDFLDVELLARQKVLSRLKKEVDVRLFDKYFANPECLYRFPCVGELYGKMEMISDISCDTKLGKLINDSCNTVLISSAKDFGSSFRNTTRRYLCKIMDKLKSAITIAIGKKAVDELMLLSDSVRQLQVQFVLDPFYIERLKCNIENLSLHHLRLLFPNFEHNKLPLLKVMDSFGLLNEEELVLNSRQMNVYNLLTERKVLIDGDLFTPPILLTGPVSTGKTFLLARCLRALLRTYSGIQPNRILICTHSDLAADAYITDYLHPWLINDEVSVQRSKPLRVYDADRFVDSVSGAVKHYCLFKNDGGNFRCPTKEEVLSHKVIIVTLSVCTDLIDLGLHDDTFSHIFIDEATQCLEAECIEPILLAGENTKVVIAGDVMQTYLGMFAVSKGVPPISLLERLRNIYPFRHPFVVNLIENYTNHEVIVKFISEVFYHDQLRPASNQPCHPVYYPLTFHHISSSRELQPDNGGGYYNMEEIRCIVDFTEELMRTWPEVWGNPHEKDSVIVLTPYTNHVIGLRVQLQLKGLQSVNVEMVSNVIGKRYRVVIISTVRTYNLDSDGSDLDSQEDGLLGGFFYDRRLINTAISCAKSLVIVFGDAKSLWSNGSCREVWRKYISECHMHQSLRGFTHHNVTKPEIKESAVVLEKPNVSSEFKHLGRIQGNTDLNTKKIPSLFDTPTIGRSFQLHNDAVPKLGKKETNLPETRIKNVQSTDSWKVPRVSLHEGPKTDLFSAFSSNTEPLYGQSPRVELDLETKKVVNLVLDPFKSVSVPLKLGNQKSDSRRLEGYRSPFELPSVTSNSSSFNSLEIPKGNNMECVTPLISPEPMPLPMPTIPSQALFNTNYFISDSPNLGISNTNRSFGFGSVHSSPQKFISPLVRGPPGFPSVLCEPKSGTASENQNSEPLNCNSTSPYRGSGSGFTAKYGYKRNTYGYELPPRMQRNLQISNHRSPTPRKATPKQRPTEMNFFEELGLDSETKETTRSSSSTSSSSDNSFTDVDETVCVVQESSDLSSQNDWIEVKNTRKGKSQPVKKVKSKEKNVTNVISEVSPEMNVDDKVELITQMGFTRNQAIKALQICDKDLQGAVDWLISKPTSNKSSF